MIIPFTKDTNATPDFNMAYPDQFLKEKQKLKSKTWIKGTADYFANIAYMQYNANKRAITKNYNLIKGIITKEDLYESESTELKSFTQVLTDNMKLPEHVQHYSIMTSPINQLQGELVKRPDTHRIKAFDDESKSAELNYKTDLYHQYIRQRIEQEVRMSYEISGEEPEQSEELSPQQAEEQEIQQLTLEKLKQYMTDYTSIGERWGNHIIESCKAEFNMKEKSEECFRDLTICAQEYFHIYEDISKLGFNVEAANPKNVWKLSTPDRKYTKDAYAAGTVEVMEISEIIEKVTDLTKEEIDHLRGFSKLSAAGTLIGRSNYGSSAAGIDTIKYDTYNRAILQERMLAESDLQADNKDILTELFGYNVSLSQYGEKFVVVRGYFKSKKLIKKVEYIDENNEVQVLLTDENYEDGSMPTELSVEEGWTTQWYQFTKIGSDVYKMKPFKLLDYCPIIGVVAEIKNTKARSFVDMMKPFQALYNLCMNQLWEILRKEYGVVYNIVLRKIPTPKDGDAQDALDIWEEEARAKGILFEDDSPENMKVVGGNTNNSRAIDLSRTAEIQSRYELAARLKNECWDLIGMSRQRMGSVQATETATATNTAITQSYAQTEPLYAQHEYVMDQVYQAILDAAQYIESEKPLSTVSYINSVGESVFLEITGPELKAKDLKLFSTSRAQDQQTFNELKQLAQPMLQNGASVYDIVTLYTTQSVRQMKQVFKTLKEEQQAFQQRQDELKQQQLDQEQKQHEAEMQQAELDRQENIENENYNKAEDRINKREIATIMAASKNPAVLNDSDGNGVADALEVTRLVNEEIAINKDHSARLAELGIKDRHKQQELDLERERIRAERERTKSEHEIKLKEIAVKKAQIKAKPKPPAKKKK
jgi:hypothetical protein